MSIDEFIEKWKPFPAIPCSNLKEQKKYNTHFMEELYELIKEITIEQEQTEFGFPTELRADSSWSYHWERELVNKIDEEI